MAELLPLLREYPGLLWAVVGTAAATWIIRQIVEVSGPVRAALMAVSGPLGRAVAARSRRRDRRRAAEAADILYLEGRVDALAGRLEDVAAEHQMQADYLAYDAAWHANVRVALAEQGTELPPPPHLTYTQWRAAQIRDPPS